MVSLGLGLGIGLPWLALLAAVVCAGWRMGRPPEGRPADLLAAGGPPDDRPVWVCLGDAFTCGGRVGDRVGGLRQRVEGRAVVLNAGGPGEVRGGVRQRLDEVARRRPMGALGGRWASRHERGRPQAPSAGWFVEQLDAPVAGLAAAGSPPARGTAS